MKMMKRSIKTWSKAEMQKHGFEIYYYGGWHIDLKAPKDLSAEEHYDYLTQKSNYINTLGKKSERK